MERGVDRRDDGRRKHQDLGWYPFLAYGLKSGRKQWQERLDRENRLQEMCVEEIGEAGRRDGCNRRGLVVEAGNEDDGFERQVVRFDVWPWGLWRLQVVGELFNGSASLRRLFM